jgi:hypothetical protein
MRSESVPIIRLTVENMTQAICSHMGIENSELENLIHQRVKELNIQKKIDEMVVQELNNSVRKACQEYFQFGEGNDMVVESVKKIISKQNVKS